MSLDNSNMNQPSSPTTQVNVYPRNKAPPTGKSIFSHKTPIPPEIKSMCTLHQVLSQLPNWSDQKKPPNKPPT